MYRTYLKRQQEKELWTFVVDTVKERGEDVFGLGEKVSHPQQNTNAIQKFGQKARANFPHLSLCWKEGNWVALTVQTSVFCTTKKQREEKKKERTH